MKTNGERWAPRYQPNRAIAPFYSLTRSAWIAYMLMRCGRHPHTH